MLTYADVADEPEWGDLERGLFAVDSEGGGGGWGLGAVSSHAADPCGRALIEP